MGAGLGNKNAVKEIKRNIPAVTHGTPDEVKTWRQRAQDTGKKFAAWMRDRLNA